MKPSPQVVQDIVTYIAATRKATQSYTAAEQKSMNTFLDQLQQTDYLQAELVVRGYLLCDGKALQDVLPAARAIQMTHTYAEMLASQQSGIAAASGLHAAEIILANLSCAEELRLKAVSITNRALLLYMHALASNEQTDHVQHCYATESTLNPLHVGMVLAGADCAATDAITAFALAWGRALRLRDDGSVQDTDAALAALTMWTDEQSRPLRELYQASIRL